MEPWGVEGKLLVLRRAESEARTLTVGGAHAGRAEAAGLWPRPWAADPCSGALP